MHEEKGFHKIHKLLQVKNGYDAPIELLKNRERSKNEIDRPNTFGGGDGRKRVSPSTKHRTAEFPLRRRFINPQPDICPQLTAEMINDVDEVFDDETSNRHISGTLNLPEYLSLSGQQWLEDEVIDNYMQLIVERSQKDNLKSIYVFSAFFYGFYDAHGYESSSSFTDGVNIFEYDMIVFPVHLAFHWRLICIDVKNKLITAFDSNKNDNTPSLTIILDYLEKEYTSRLGKKPKPYFEGFYVLNQAEIPTQKNQFDCGVFICQYMEYMARKANMAFSQRNMPYFRYIMAYELLQGELLPRSFDQPRSIDD